MTRHAVIVHAYWSTQRIVLDAGWPQQGSRVPHHVSVTLTTCSGSTRLNIDNHKGRADASVRKRNQPNHRSLKAQQHEQQRLDTLSAPSGNSDRTRLTIWLNGAPTSKDRVPGVAGDAVALAAST